AVRGLVSAMTPKITAMTPYSSRIHQLRCRYPAILALLMRSGKKCVGKTIARARSPLQAQDCLVSVNANTEPAGGQAMCFRALLTGAKGSPSRGGPVILASLVDSSSARPPRVSRCLVRKLMKITGQTAAEIFDSVRRLVHAGRLAPGDALPPVRQLASALGVNRNTVASAYRRLVAAGVAVTRGRHGTLIRSSPQLPEHEGRIHD